MRLSLRILAVFEGIVGAFIGFAISLAASLLRVIGEAVGVSTDQAHFFLAIALSLLAFVGALLAIGPGLAAAICLVVAAIGLFFVAGWWAIIPALFLLPAAWLAYVASRIPELAPVAAPQPQPVMAPPRPQPTITEAPRQRPLAETSSYSSAPVSTPLPIEAHSNTPYSAVDTPAAETAAAEASPRPISAEQPAAQPEPQPRRESLRRTEPPPDTSLPGAPA